jgi:putative transposase
MPNHIHGIVEISQQTLAQQAASLQGTIDIQPEVRRMASFGQDGRRTPSLSIVVRSFKADVTRRAGIELQWKKEMWQQNYFDRVIRDGREFANVSRYIAENPMRWQIQGQRSKTDQGARRPQRAAALQRDRA